MDDVKWEKTGSRLVLQDELDLVSPPEFLTNPEQTHELVRIAYTRLVEHFDRALSFDLAEQCWVGAMEMARLDPSAKSLSRILPRALQDSSIARWMERNVSILNAYRVVSEYGSNYRRAAMWLVAVFGVFGGLYALPSSGLTGCSGVDRAEWWRCLCNGMLHSLQVGTLSSDTTRHVTASIGIWLMTLQPTTVATIAALFLLALRRRFHRGH